MSNKFELMDQFEGYLKRQKDPQRRLCRVMSYNLLLLLNTVNYFQTFM